MVKLVIEPEETTGQLARRLIEQAKQQLTDEALQRDFINLIEIIIVYKLPQKSRTTEFLHNFLVEYNTFRKSFAICCHPSGIIATKVLSQHNWPFLKPKLL